MFLRPFYINALDSKYRQLNILICGKTGVGKTTTINTLFGKEVGKIGDFGRGTSQDSVYKWGNSIKNRYIFSQPLNKNSNPIYWGINFHTGIFSAESDINIIDLPGLGDSELNDIIFEEIYRRRAKEANAFIVVVAPPRPAEVGTLKAIKVLIESGVSSKHIIFGYNQLSFLNYKNKDGKRCRVEILDNCINGLIPEHIDVVNKAKQVFLQDIKSEFPSHEFSESQIIQYDSGTGWNLHKMFIAAIDVQPKLRSFLMHFRIQFTFAETSFLLKKSR